MQNYLELEQFLINLPEDFSLKEVVEEYLKITGKTELDKTRFVIQDIDDAFPGDRVRDLLNKRKGDSR